MFARTYILLLFVNMLPLEFKALANIDLLRSKQHLSLKIFEMDDVANGYWKGKMLPKNVFHSLTKNF